MKMIVPFGGAVLIARLLTTVDTLHEGMYIKEELLAA